MYKAACKDCNENFELNEEEIKFFNQKGFPLPKRCKSCRAKKRAAEHIEGKA